MHQHILNIADGECMKSIPISKFCNHIEQLHADRDRLFETEYTVSQSTSNALSAHCTVN